MTLITKTGFFKLFRDYLKGHFSKNLLTKKLFYSKAVTAKQWDVFSIELTNHCPMRCDACPRTKDMTRPLGFMKLSLFQKIIDQASGKINSVWLHHFGDSLVHPEFEKCISYAHKKGIKTKLSANAILLNETTCKKIIQSKLDKLIISLDSIDEESQTKTRGIPGVYQKSKDNVNRFLEIRKTFGSKKPYTVLQMVKYEYTKKIVPIFIKILA